MGIEEVLTAPGSPWQNAFVERLIGSIRRDCLDHVIVLNERHLKRILNRYFDYYHRWRTHLSLEMDTPESRLVQRPACGKVVQFPEVGGLHHHYERRHETVCYEFSGTTGMIPCAMSFRDLRATFQPAYATCNKLGVSQFDPAIYYAP
jgi:hypothetical protein